MTTQETTYQTPADSSKEIPEIHEADLVAVGRTLVQANRARTGKRTRAQIIKDYTAYGYDYYKAAAIAEAAMFLDAFTMDGEYFDFREVK
jgi:hypothetical protein